MFHRFKSKPPTHYQIARDNLDAARVQLLEAEATSESAQCTVLILKSRVERLRQYVGEDTKVISAATVMVKS